MNVNDKMFSYPPEGLVFKKYSKALGLASAIGVNLWIQLFCENLYKTMDWGELVVKKA